MWIILVSADRIVYGRSVKILNVNIGNMESKQTFQAIKQSIKSSFLFNRYGPVRQRIELWEWQFRGRSVPVPHLVKQRYIKQYARQFSLDTLVETGTYLGTMIDATKNDFRRIFSVELDPILYERARQRFAHLQHVTMFNGDSSTCLPNILTQIKHPSLFWLDAHYSGGITAKGSLDTPIMSELQHIFAHSLKGHVILIDDAHMFVGENDYPTLSELKSYILEHYPGQTVEVQDDMIRIHGRVEQ